MAIGISSWTYGWSIGVKGYPHPAVPLTALGLLARAKQLGVGVVQFADNIRIEHPECLRQSQIAIELGTRGTDCETLQHFLKLARILNAKLLRALPGPDAEQSIRKMLPAFVEAGVCLALENYEKTTSAELAALVRSINDPHVGICLDTVNSLGALETPRDVVAELGPYVLNLHVKDFQIQRVPSMMGFLVTGCPAGDGLLDLPWLLSELARYGRHPNCILELWTPFTETVEQTIAMEQEWARRSIEYLRRFQS